MAKVPAWQYQAACRGKPLALFFPEGQGASPDPAIEVCQGCLVREPCARWAIAEGLDMGVFGGLSERQRKAARRDAA